MALPTPLILLHGALASRDQFTALRKLLEDDHEVYDLNFSGHGDNRSIHDFSMERFTADVVEMMEDKGITHANFFGYSMGGYVALLVARNFPSLVGRVITLATKFDWTPESAAQETRRLIPEKVEAKVPAFADTLRLRHGDPHWKQVMLKTSRMMTGLGQGDAMKPQDFRDILQPVLLMVGELDHMVSAEETLTIADVLPRGELRVLEGIHHPFESLDPAMIKEEIERFI